MNYYMNSKGIIYSVFYEGSFYHRTLKIIDIKVFNDLSSDNLIDVFGGVMIMKSGNLLIDMDIGYKLNDGSTHQLLSKVKYFIRNRNLILLDI